MSVLSSAIHKISAILILAMLLVPVLINSPVAAASYSSSYVSPEVVYADQLSQKIPVPRKVNLNRASLNELVTLPGVDQNIAFKLIRIRPVENIQDLYKMQWVDKRNIKTLIDTLQQRVEF